MSKKQKKKSPRPKREKIIWVDDGSTVADMSGVGGRRRTNPHHTPPPRQNGRPYSRFRECATTYFAAVKMMLLPMLVVIGILCVVFLLLWLAMGTMV